MQRLTLVAAAFAFLLLSGVASAGSIVIDMPALPRSQRTGGDGGAAATTYIDYKRADGADVGAVALLRYARGRSAPYYTAPGYGGYGRYYYSRIFAGYPYYGVYYVPRGPYYGYPYFGSPFCGCGSYCLGFCGFHAFPSFVRVVR